MLFIESLSVYNCARFCRICQCMCIGYSTHSKMTVKDLQILQSKTNDETIRIIIIIIQFYDISKSSGIQDLHKYYYALHICLCIHQVPNYSGHNNNIKTTEEPSIVNWEEEKKRQEKRQNVYKREQKHVKLSCIHDRAQHSKATHSTRIRERL